MSRYLIAGGLSFIVDFGLLALLHDLLTWPLWLSTAIAFIVSFVFSYLIQRSFGFSSQAAYGSSLLKYSTLVVANLLLTVVIVTLVQELGSLWEVGKVIATVSTAVWNYFLYRSWIFPEVKSATSSPSSAT